MFSNWFFQCDCCWKFCFGGIGIWYMYCWNDKWNKLQENWWECFLKSSLLLPLVVLLLYYYYRCDIHSWYFHNYYLVKLLALHVWCICVYHMYECSQFTPQTCTIFFVYWFGSENIETWKSISISILSLYRSFYQISISTQQLCSLLVVYARRSSCANCHLQAKNEGTLCTACIPERYCKWTREWCGTECTSQQKWNFVKLPRCTHFLKAQEGVK